MPAIISIGTALPPHVITQREVKQFAHNIYGEAFADVDRLMGVTSSNFSRGMSR
jgi:alkylresorcinol/alkylpyrone synthase